MLFICILGSGIAYVVRYALRVRSNPDLSRMADDPAEHTKLVEFQHDTGATALQFRPRQVLAGLIAAFFVVMVWGVLTRHWFMRKMAGLFVIMGMR